MLVIVGSTAVKEYLPDREVDDYDAFADPITKIEMVQMGVDNAKLDIYWNEDFLQYWPQDTLKIASLDEIYTIKVSHSYWDLRNGSWDKHITDVIRLKQAGAKIIQPLHDLLYKIWEKDHGKKVVSLQQDKDSFFTDAVTRIYDHDSIHYSVAYGDKPIYESVFKDGQEIEMDMNKVKALPFEECVRLFREEIYATALERWVIPENYKISPGLAYTRALRKTITSLTKGWSAQFLVENYETFARPDMKYVDHHKTKLDQLIKL